MLPAVNIGEETKFNVLIKGVSINDKLQLPLPVTISGPGFSAEQQWYLCDKIQELCRRHVSKNLTCQLPDVERPGKA